MDENDELMGIELNIDPKAVALVVDDHPLTREMVRSILRSIGFNKILQAESGVQAQEIIENQKVDIVLCDWNMPNGSGIDLLRAIRANPRFQDLPFLMLTAEAYRENIVAAVKAGVTDYVAKPFTAGALSQKISEILAKGR